jgi:hypothetical protein
VKRLDPFADPGFVAVSGVAASARGDLYYAALKLPPAGQPLAVESALVHVPWRGEPRRASYPSLVPGAPDAGASCFGVFRTPRDARPFPPVDDAGVPRPTPVVTCTPQRPAVSAVPAIGPDGTVYVMSRAHDNANYSYLAAVGPDLEPRWAATLRGRLADGCGVALPFDPGVGPVRLDLCRPGATTGVDPRTNLPPAGQVVDSSSSSPVVLPDGTIAYGAFTAYNTSRGHLMRFSASGDFLGSFDFGWDLTPAAWEHDGTFSVAVKDNRYFEWNRAPPSYFLGSLDSNLAPRWRFQNTNASSCSEDGGCVEDHPWGFEWCISAPAVDVRGNIYGNAEDGNLYVVGADGGLQARRFLKLALGAAYTPLALDARGRIYALNGGELFVLGK